MLLSLARDRVTDAGQDLRADKDGNGRVSRV